MAFIDYTKGVDVASPFIAAAEVVVGNAFCKLFENPLEVALLLRIRS